MKKLKVKDVLSLIREDEKVNCNFTAYGIYYASSWNDGMRTAKDCLEGMNYNCLNAIVTGNLSIIQTIDMTQNMIQINAELVQQKGKKMIKRTSDCSFFLRTFYINKKDVIRNRAEHHSHINYEIEKSIGDLVLIRPSCLKDLQLEMPNKLLYSAMNLIADYTNNQFDCGCTFTMGW